MKLNLFTQTRVMIPIILSIFFTLQVPFAHPGGGLEVDDITFTEAIKDISQQYDVYFTFDLALVRDLKVSESYKEVSNVNAAIQIILKNTDLQFQILQNRFVILYKNDAEGLKSMKEMIRQMEGIMAQQEEIIGRKKVRVNRLSTKSTLDIFNKRFVMNVQGRVVDQSGEPLIGVNVLVKGTDQGTATDFDGSFSLEDVDANAVLVISYIGYQTQEVAVNGRNEIEVVLLTDSEMLEEVVVVGYGTQHSREITSSLKQVGGDELSSQPSVQTSAALMGKVSGLQVIQSSGKPGQNNGTIRIRGTGTLGNSNPLILIDGVQGNIDNVPSTDIESITVLKDAAAAAIYGSRAANGVILVTTRRGSSDKFQVRYRGFMGYQKPTRQPKYVEGSDFMRLENLAIANIGGTPIWTEDYINEWESNYKIDPDNYPNTNWVKEVFSESGFQQNQNLNITGGTAKASFLGSLNYNEELGNIKNFGFKRYTIRLNSDIEASEKFKLSLDVNLQRRDRDEATDERDIIQEAYRIPPVFAARYTDGTWGPGWNGSNPVAAIYDGGFILEEQSEVNARIYSTFQPIDDIVFSVLYSPQFRSRIYKSMQRQYQYKRSTTGETQLNPAINFLNQGFNRDFGNNFNFTFTWNHTIRDHNFQTLGGYEFVDFRNDNFSAFRDNFTLQDYDHLNAGSEANQQNSGSAYEWALQSYFGRFNYNFKSKYLLEANLRYDGSSRFTTDRRWGLFPSISLGWVVSDEDIFKSIDILSFFKIRTSYGQLGNQQIGNYPYSSVISLGETYLVQDSPKTGAAQVDLANPNISWEKTESSGIGIDVGLFEDKLNFTFDYFDRKTTDILLQLPIPLIIGLNPPFQNAGAMENKGWEFEIGYKNQIGTDFSYNISGNISEVKNKVTNLYNTGPYISGGSITAEGYPIGSIYGYESNGFFQNQEEINLHAKQNGQIAPGDIRYVDQNGDNVINADDRVVIGNPFPSINYGVDFEFKYKGLDLSIFFQGVGKRDVRLTNFVVRAFYNAGKITEWQANDYWRPDNPNASYPRLTQGDTHSNFEVSDFWVYNASYLRLRNLQLGYNLPQRLLDPVSIDRIRIFFLGHNLFTFLDNLPQGVDPNVPNGTGGSYYTTTKLISFGLEIDF